MSHDKNKAGELAPFNAYPHANKRQRASEVPRENPYRKATRSEIEDIIIQTLRQKIRNNFHAPYAISCNVNLYSPDNGPVGASTFDMVRIFNILTTAHPDFLSSVNDPGLEWYIKEIREPTPCLDPRCGVPMSERLPTLGRIRDNPPYDDASRENAQIDRLNTNRAFQSIRLFYCGHCGSIIVDVRMKVKDDKENIV